MATECCVCLEQFELDGDKCPKLLPCTHTLCLQSLQQLCNGRPRVRCPECCAFNDAPEGNAKKFQTNRYMLEILTCKEKIAHLEETAKSSKVSSTCNSPIIDGPQMYHICLKAASFLPKIWKFLRCEM